ncbi:MAG: hypothetical protein R3B06_32290 [Kofleriaceae bacterium]
MAGAERGECRADGSCAVGLECWSERCVRPPGADCAAVAQRLVGYRVGNYATVEERAPVLAELAGACQAAQLTAREGACLTVAVGEDALLACPRVLVPALEAKRASTPATPGGPTDPWNPTGQAPPTSACEEYARALERYAACPALPAPSRASFRTLVPTVRQTLTNVPQPQRAATERNCRAASAAVAAAVASLGCPS